MQSWRSVVFVDLDDTILEGPFETAVFPTVLRELAQKSKLDEKEVRRLIVQENFGRQTDKAVTAISAMDWDDIFCTVAERLKVRLEVNAIDIVNTHAAPPYSVLLDNAYQVLSKLAQPNRAVVAATKGLRKYQIPVLDALNLTSLFTDILTPDTNNALKQDIAFYGKWAYLANIHISVGDHYQDDVIAPKKFGFKSIWKPTTQNVHLEQVNPFDRVEKFNYAEGQTVLPDAIIFHLDELPKVVDYFEDYQSTPAT